MNSERKLHGIPYFGEDTQAITESILNEKEDNCIEYGSLYDLIQEEATSNKVVVINNKYLTYLRDIRFNYRDKKVYLPYYEYQETLCSGDIRNVDGHLFLKDGSLLIRHSYKLCKVDIKKEEPLVLYDIDTRKKYKVSFYRFYLSIKFSIEKLYDLYINSCYIEDDMLVGKHVEGYHLISKELAGVSNRERKIRKYNLLPDYADSDVKVELGYRDVRQYKLDQLGISVAEIGGNSKRYWERILDFESYLYCILRESCLPEEMSFRSEWNSLGKKNAYIKYGGKRKLILKEYWLNNKVLRKKESWSRV